MGVADGHHQHQLGIGSVPRPDVGGIGHQIEVDADGADRNQIGTIGSVADATGDGDVAQSDACSGRFDRPEVDGVDQPRLGHDLVAEPALSGEPVDGVGSHARGAHRADFRDDAGEGLGW